MKKSLKRNVALCLCVAIMALSIFAGKLNALALAPDGGHYYQGVIEANHENTRFDCQKRSTTKKSDPFYVRLNTSTESSTGSLTVTRFWIENKDKDNLSDTIDVTLKKGWYARNTYQSGCNTEVFLTAENNNYNSSVYTVSGRWEEE